MADSIHFKITNNGETRRFVIPYDKDRDAMLEAVREKVSSMVGTKDTKLMWKNAASSSLPLESNLSTAIDYAIATAKSMPPCVYLVAAAPAAKEELQREEEKAAAFIVPDVEPMSEEEVKEIMTSANAEYNAETRAQWIKNMNVSFEKERKKDSPIEESTDAEDDNCSVCTALPLEENDGEEEKEEMFVKQAAAQMDNSALNCSVQQAPSPTTDKFNEYQLFPPMDKLNSTLHNAETYNPYAQESYNPYSPYMQQGKSSATAPPSTIPSFSSYYHSNPADPTTCISSQWQSYYNQQQSRYLYHAYPQQREMEACCGPIPQTQKGNWTAAQKEFLSDGQQMPTNQYLANLQQQQQNASSPPFDQQGMYAQQLQQHSLQEAAYKKQLQQYQLQQQQFAAKAKHQFEMAGYRRKMLQQQTDYNNLCYTNSYCTQGAATASQYAYPFYANATPHGSQPLVDENARLKKELEETKKKLEESKKNDVMMRLSEVERRLKEMEKRLEENEEKEEDYERGDGEKMAELQDSVDDIVERLEALEDRF